MGALDDARAHLAKAQEFLAAAEQAVAELAQAGGVDTALTQTFSRLLRMKPAAQYQASSVTPADAGKAVQWAMRMLQVTTDLAAWALGASPKLRGV